MPQSCVYVHPHIPSVAKMKQRAGWLGLPVLTVILLLEDFICEREEHIIVEFLFQFIHASNILKATSIFACPFHNAGKTVVSCIKQTVITDNS